MTTLITTVIALAIALLVWCFIGFARDLKRPRLFAVLVRWKTTGKGAPNQIKTVIEFSDWKSSGLGDEQRLSKKAKTEKPTPAEPFATSRAGSG